MISIIIPVYNGEKFIESAIQQILKEDLGTFEIIFIDNNSEDSSLGLLKKAEQEYTMIKVFTEKKQGAGAARNTGIKHAVGDYIYFFDVDDLLVKGALKVMRNFLKENPEVDSIFGESLRVNSREVQESIGANIDYEYREKPYWGMEWFQHFSKLFGTPSFLHKRRIFNKIEAFPEEIRIGEDAFFHIKIGLTFNIVKINQPVFFYYRHPGSTVSKNNKKHSRAKIYWKQYITTYIPYCKTHKTPAEFQILLRKKLYASIFKILLEEKKIAERKKLSYELLQKMEPVKMPFLFRWYMQLLIISGNTYIYKFFAFYILPYYNKDLQEDFK